MRPALRATLWLFTLAALAGCASSQVTERKSYIGDEKLARPGRILVYDFFSAPADGSAETSASTATRASAAAPGAHQNSPPIEEVTDAHRKLGIRVAEELVADIRNAGFPAVRAVGEPAPQNGDIVIKGNFVNLDKGAAEKRVLLGFGSGAAKLKTVVDGYQMTDQGLRPLASSEIQAGSGKMPGLVLPLAVVAVTANPIGLIVGGTAKAVGEADGSDTIDGAAKRTAGQISEELVAEFHRQDWAEAAAAGPEPTTGPTTGQAPGSAPADVAAVPTADPDPGDEPFVVQLASFTTAQSAQQEWTALQGRFPTVLDDKSQILQPASVAGVGQVIRLQAGPFPSHSAATDACSQLLAERQDCFVMKR